MIRLVLLSQDDDLDELQQALEARASGICSIHRAADLLAAHAEVAVCWNPPSGSLGALPSLRLIHSIAAGVDHLASDPSRPPIATCRVVDPDLRRGMAEYVIWGVLHHFRRFDSVLQNQSQRQWRVPTQLRASEWRIGVLGLGELGGYVAQQLAGLGFAVRGWSRSAKTIDGVSCWAGNGALEAFADGLDCLVCLLPLTDESQGILNAGLFGRLRNGAVLINPGRGGHLQRADLLLALQSGQLRAALLDAFEQEPLPASDPLWSTAGVTLTPHMASSASNEVIAEQVLANVQRMQAGLSLLNQVDPDLGY